MIKVNFGWWKVIEKDSSLLIQKKNHEKSAHGKTKKLDFQGNAGLRKSVLNKIITQTNNA